MQPFTTILPKPLIPVKGKPVITHIMNTFKSDGFTSFSVSINNSNNVLKSYLSEMCKIHDFNIISEKKPLGSAGCLKKDRKSRRTFFVVNCDSLLKIKPSQLLNFHNENKNDLTMVAALKEFNIPYGVCEVNKKNGRLSDMKEKPKNMLSQIQGCMLLNQKF